MRVFKTTYRDRQGVTQESSKWYVEFRDHAETIRRLPAFTSKQASEAFGQNLEKLISYHRATGGLTDPVITAMALADSTIHEGKASGDRAARREKSGGHEATQQASG